MPFRLVCEIDRTASHGFCLLFLHENVLCNLRITIGSPSHGCELIDAHLRSLKTESSSTRMNPITRHDFQMDICDRMYGCNEIPTLDYIHPHKLAVFFGIMSLGVMRIDAADTIQSKRYHTLSCAALSLAPIISEAMCATIQALYLANAFLFTTVHVASEECWLLVGLCGRLGYRVSALANVA